MEISLFITTKVGISIRERVRNTMKERNKREATTKDDNRGSVQAA